jgi:hypothetical protein
MPDIMMKFLLRGQINSPIVDARDLPTRKNFFAGKLGIILDNLSRGKCPANP